MQLYNLLAHPLRWYKESQRSPTPQPFPQGSKDPNNWVLGPKYHNIHGIWARKPDYLGPWTLRVQHDSSCVQECVGQLLAGAKASHHELPNHLSKNMLVSQSRFGTLKVEACWRMLGKHGTLIDCVAA